MTKTNLKWRLGKLPSVTEVTLLIEKSLITEDEARDILFSSETQEGKNIESLEAEIKFLKELVEKLSSKSEVRIIETIKEIERPYRNWDWYGPTVTYCSNGSYNGTTTQLDSLDCIDKTVLNS